MTVIVIVVSIAILRNVDLDALGSVAARAIDVLQAQLVLSRTATSRIVSANPADGHFCTPRLFRGFGRFWHAFVQRCSCLDRKSVV